MSNLSALDLDRLGRLASGVEADNIKALCREVRERRAADLNTTELAETSELLARVGSFDLSNEASPRELAAIVRLLCECMIEAGLGEDDL